MAVERGVVKVGGLGVEVQAGWQGKAGGSCVDSIKQIYGRKLAEQNVQTK